MCFGSRLLESPSQRRGGWRREDENEVSYGWGRRRVLGTWVGWRLVPGGFGSIFTTHYLPGLAKARIFPYPIINCESSWCGMCGLYLEPGFFNLRWYFWPDNFFVVLFGGGELGGCPVPCRMFSGIPPTRLSHAGVMTTKNVFRRCTGSRGARGVGQVTLS